MSLCTPKMSTGVFASGRKPSASSGRCNGGFGGGGWLFECDSRWWYCECAGDEGCADRLGGRGGGPARGAGDARRSSARAGPVMSNRSIAFEM